MKRSTVAPGLDVDEDEYELLIEALRTRVPDAADVISACTWEYFENHRHWLRTCSTGELAGCEESWDVAEFELPRDGRNDRILGVSKHIGPATPRQGVTPHGHACREYVRHVLRGGIVEDCFWLDTVDHPLLTLPNHQHAAGPMTVSRRERFAGSTDTFGPTAFHSVFGLAAPAPTLVLMEFRSPSADDRGYLELAPDGTLAYVPRRLSSTWRGVESVLRHLNPHYLS